jgi:hypothetical protein
MQRLTAVLSLLFVAAFLLPDPALVQAQEVEEGPSYAYIMTMELAPADRGAYRDALKLLVEAAGQAGISEEYEWHFWSRDRGYTLVYPFENMAYWDDPDQFWAMFEGTEGEAKRDEFFEAVQQIPGESSSEVTVGIPELTYWPEGFDGGEVAHVHHYWLNAGAYEGFKELGQEFVAFLGEIGYPYGMIATETMFGEDKIAWIFFADTRSGYYSDETWDDLVEAAGAQDKRDAIMARFDQLVRRWKHFDAQYVEEMSYPQEDDT